MIGALLGAGYTNLSIVLLQLFVILFAFFRLFVYTFAFSFGMQIFINFLCVLFPYEGPSWS